MDCHRLLDFPNQVFRKELVTFFKIIFQLSIIGTCAFEKSKRLSKIVDIQAVHDEYREFYRSAHQVIKDFLEDLDLDLLPLDELDCDSLALGPFAGSVSLLVFLSFNPQPDPVEGSSSLSLSFLLLFNVTLYHK
uniref:Uncharacterized protein n=1 Tax=Tanacetum cinerariifolium TaxID=118510 RepID=A0A699HS23_TANCI|nr:hypothetical protein [Tanacetum cinerariifolium]